MAAQRRGANLLRTAPMGVPHEKIYGIEAARAVMATRPGDVIRIAHTSAVRHEIAELLREAAAQRIAYGEHSEEDLGKLAGALHHEGICLAVQPRRVLSVDALVNALRDGKCRAVLALDTVANPHNAGALVRSAAFFGVDAILVEGQEGKPLLTPAATRIAQGAMEHVVAVRAGDMADALRRIAAAGVAVVGTDVRATKTLGEMKWPVRVAIVLGSEGAGMREPVRRACTELLVIPGSGKVESLNVSVAAALLLYEARRRRGDG